jgi:hypothetical protein
MVPLPVVSPVFARLAPAAACIAALLWLGGCTIGGSSTASAQNDELRRKVAEQQRQIESLAAARDELQTKLAANALDAGADPEVAAATPVVSVLEIDSLSTLLPLEAKGPATGLRVHVRTLDGRRRFTQAVGVMTVELKDGADATLAAGRVGPAALRDAYRSSVTGTHYTIETSLANPAAGTTFTLTVRFEDALTGRRLEASKELAR